MKISPNKSLLITKIPLLFPYSTLYFEFVQILTFDTLLVKYSYSVPPIYSGFSYIRTSIKTLDID